MEKNIMMAVSIIVPVVFIIASKWLVPLFEKRFKEKAKTVYFVIAFVIIIVLWYLIDTHYDIHIGLW